MASGAVTVKSTAITLLDSTPARVPLAANFGGPIRGATYEAAAPGIGAIVKMVRCQKGEVILGGEVWWDAMGSSTVITVGDSADTDRYMTNCPVATAKAAMGTQTGNTGVFNAIDGINYELTAETDINIYFNDQSPTGTLVLVVHVGMPSN